MSRNISSRLKDACYYYPLGTPGGFCIFCGSHKSVEHNKNCATILATTELDRLTKENAELRTLLKEPKAGDFAMPKDELKYGPTGLNKPKAGPVNDSSGGPFYIKKLESDIEELNREILSLAAENAELQKKIDLDKKYYGRCKRCLSILVSIDGSKTCKKCGNLTVHIIPEIELAKSLQQIAELQSELATYKAGNVPVTQMIADNEAIEQLQSELAEEKKEIERLKQ